MKLCALKTTVVTVFALLCFQGASSARTWHLVADGTGDAETLETALQLAADGDSILLGPGSYLADEFVETRGKSMTLAAAIEGSYPTVSSLGFWDQSYVEITGCQFSYADIGLILSDSEKATVTDCIFPGGRQGLLVYADTVEISRSAFRGNSGALPPAGLDGGALYLSSNDPNDVHVSTVSDCVFDNNASANYGGAVYVCASASSESRVKMERNLFINNESTFGGAVWVEQCSEGTFEATRNTFVRNKAIDGALVVVVRGLIKSNLFAQNDCFGFGVLGPELFGNCNLLWGNRADQTGFQAFGFFNWTRDADIDLAPDFCGASGGNYYELAETSPALVSNFTGDVRVALCDETMGAFGIGCAVSPTLRRSWGAVKNGFLTSQRSMRQSDANGEPE